MLKIEVQAASDGLLFFPNSHFRNPSMHEKYRQKSPKNRGFVVYRTHPKAGPYVHRNPFETGTGFRFLNSCSVSNEISGHFSCSTRAGKKMEQDFERIHGSKSRISQILFLFGGIPVYIRTGLRPVLMPPLEYRFWSLFFFFVGDVALSR